jgi:peptidoglycan/LPS O-acetylase OafA/YrhL
VRLAGIDYRNNSIGFLRLLFATLVIYSHGFGLGGFGGGNEPLVALSGNAWSFGGLAVCGFFFLSGFLVTRSYEGLRSLPRFLWHRVVRIFPGYWVCLLVSVFLFAPSLYFAAHGSLAGYWTAPDPGNPLTYLTRNYSLDVFQFQIADLFTANVFPHVFNGSIWTLGNEFRAYLTLAILGVLGVLTSRRAIVLAVLVVLWVASIFVTSTTGLLEQHRLLFGVFEGSYAFEEMFVYFFAGSVAYLYREQIPIRTSFFVICLIATFAILPLPWFRVFMPLALCYTTLWLMCRLPLRNVDRRADLSYGIYIYAFPVQQMLTMFHANRFGLTAYFALSLLVTAPLAAASWFAIEAPAMRLKNARLPFIAAAERGLARVDASWHRGRHAAMPFLEATAAFAASATRPRTILSAGAAVALVVIFAAAALRSRTTDAAPPLETAAAEPAAQGSSQTFLPPGLALAQTGSAPAPHGIFAGATQSECCWMGRTATFRVAAPTTAQRLIIHTYLPDYAYLARHHQRVNAVVDGRREPPTAPFGPGLHDIEFPLPGGRQPAVHDVDLSMDLTFEPSTLGLGTDNRELSLVLVSISSR